MGEGLRPHFHQYYENEITRYYNKKRDINVKKVEYRCMICGKTYNEYYEYRPPPKYKQAKLNKAKMKSGNL